MDHIQEPNKEYFRGSNEKQTDTPSAPGCIDIGIAIKMLS